MKKIVLALFLALIFTASAHTASRFILYDAACMDRLEYVSIEGEEKSEYFVYHVNTRPGEKIVLEVGPESRTPQDLPTAQVIKCNNAIFDAKLVNVINSEIETVFMVVKKGNNRYFISPITRAARYLQSNDYILYDSPKYRFRFDTRLGTIGENISYKNPMAEVYFEAMIENECSGKLLFQQKAESAGKQLFQQKAKFAGNPHTNIEFVPEIGIVEERSGINAADAMKNILRLEAVNGKKLSRYLEQICGGVEDPLPTEADMIVNTSPSIKRPSPAQPVPGFIGAKGETPVQVINELPQPALPKPSARTHTVKKGETLYRISKQHGVSVDQLKAWNNKGTSNTIYVGEKLMVAPATPAQTTPREGQIQSLNGPASYGNTESMPTNNGARAGLSSGLYGKDKKGASYHIVQPGQTVASIAMHYGYTEQRFREFNDLGRNEVAKAGQVLTTSDCDCPQTPVASPIVNNQRRAEPTLAAKEYINGQGRAAAERFSQEYDYLNTPLFLDRPSAPPPVREPVPVTRRERVAPEPSPAQSRKANPQSDFYTVTAEKTGIAGNSKNDGRSSGGIISRSFSNRQPTASLGARGYGNNPQEYGSTGSRLGGPRSYYEVKEGDTLYRIARQYDMTVEQLRAINDLGAKDVIIPYQKIYLE